VDLKIIFLKLNNMGLFIRISSTYATGSRLPIPGEAASFFP